MEWTIPSWTSWTAFRDGILPSLFLTSTDHDGILPSPAEKRRCFPCRANRRRASPLPDPPAVFPQRSGRGLTASTASSLTMNICRSSGSIGLRPAPPGGNPTGLEPTPPVLPRRRRRGRYCLNKQRPCYSKDSLTGACRPYDPAFTTDFPERSVSF